MSFWRTNLITFILGVTLVACAGTPSGEPDAADVDSAPRIADAYVPDALALDAADEADARLEQRDTGQPGDVGWSSDAPVCGNGVVDPEETCDLALPASCPTDCDDVDPCTVDSLVGLGCTAECVAVAVGPGAADSCCPPGATSATDPDCAAACGITGDALVRLTESAGFATLGSIAWNGTAYGAVWSEDAAPMRRVFFALLDSAGRLLGPPAALPSSNPASAPDIVWTGTEFGVAYQQYFARGSVGARREHLFLQRLSADGSALAPPVDVEALSPRPSGDALFPSIVWHPKSGYTIASWDARPSDAIYLQRMGLDGASPLPPTTMVTRASRYPELAVAPDGSFAVAARTDGNVQIVLYDASGAVDGAPISPGVDLHYDATVIHDGTTWMAAWVHVSTTESALEVLRGPRLEALTTVEAVPGGAGERLWWSPALAAARDGAVVVWANESPVTFARFNVRGALLGAPPIATSPVSVRSSLADLVTGDSTTAGLVLSAATPTTLLAGLTDFRWGRETEVAVVPVRVDACP